MSESESLSSTLLAQARAYVGALDETYAGLLLHQILHPEAVLLHHGEGKRMGDLEAREFAITFAAGHVMWEEAHPGVLRAPAFADLESLSCESEGEDRAIQWLSATERSTGAPWALALGWQKDGENWRLLWHTMRPEAESWRFAEGHAHSLGDVFLPNAISDATPRSSFDWAWCRYAKLPDPLFRQLPETRFDCQGSASCCSTGFTIDLPQVAQSLLNAIDWAPDEPPARGIQLPPGRFPGHVMLKDGDEVCRFLTADKRCLVHARMGRQPFPVCSSFPYMFVRTPEGVDVSLHVGCSSVRSGAGPDPLIHRKGDVRERLALAGTISFPAEGLPLEGEARLSWADYKGVESAWLEALASPGGLADRLWKAHRVVEATYGRHDLPEARPTCSPEAREALQAQFLASMPRLNLPSPEGAWLDAPGPLADQASSWLRAYWFSKWPLILFTNLRGSMAAAVWYALWVQALSAAQPSGQMTRESLDQLGRICLGVDPFKAMPQGDSLKVEGESGRLSEAWLGLPLAITA